ncbi:hypothetical protein HPB48_008757 [Haemaphysalis longicornis]|uniref:Uncharacterized protein n=1 Tax=Haemaphysalis longicornis TaxID=44386 RepID=A0A9J6GQN6_HAELO|nr:hypothetical protein HPB48_008757 [Haemaphysalis longicornis]
MNSTSSTANPEPIKVVATLSGDSISHADIALRIPKHPGSTLRTIVQNDCQWKLQQVQDAGNNLMSALQLLMPPPPCTKFEFKSAEEVTQASAHSLMTTIMGCLQRGRASLIIPKKRTIEEIQGSRNMKSLQPPLPQDIAASFYVQSHKLIFAVYYVHKDSHGQPKFDVFQAEASVPWLSEVLVLFTIALQLCQQLKDKNRCNTRPKLLGNGSNVQAPTQNNKWRILAKKKYVHKHFNHGRTRPLYRFPKRKKNCIVC